MQERPAIDASGLKSLLAGTFLGGREIREVPVERMDDVVLVIGVEEDELDAAWRAARTLVDRTGRWPVQSGSEEPDLFVRYYEPGGEPGLETDRRSHALGPTDLLARHEALYGAGWLEDWPARVEHQLGYTRERLGSAPSPEEVAAVIAPGDLTGLERRLLDHELRAGLTEPRDEAPPPWRSGAPYHLMLAPTVRPATTLAYISWFVYDQNSRAQVIAAVRSWNERFGRSPPSPSRARRPRSTRLSRWRGSRRRSSRRRSGRRAPPCAIAHERSSGRRPGSCGTVPRRISPASPPA
jgi:hypothetical protein